MRTVILVFLLIFPTLCSCAFSPTPTIPPVQSATRAKTLTPTPTRTITPTPSQTPSPTPMSPPFIGRIIALSRATLFELAAAEGSAGIEYRMIAEHVSAAATSPDLRYILYSTFSADLSNRLTHLYDLENRSEKIILSDTAVDIAWSTTSQFVSFTAGYGSPDIDYGIYIYDLPSNEPRLVYEPTCAGYNPLSPQSVCGKFSETIWVDENTLVFQRFSGPLPNKVTSPGYPEVASNTTTLLSFMNENPRLVDSAQRWYIQDRCGDKMLLRTETDQGWQYSITDSAGFVANSGGIEPIPVKNCQKDSSECVPLYGIWATGLPDGPYIQFVPGSCSLFYLSGESFNYVLHLLDPGTLEDHAFPFPAYGLVAFPNPSTWSESGLDQAKMQVAVMSETTEPVIQIVSLQDALAIKAWTGKDLPQVNPNVFRLLAWIVP